MVLVLSDGSLEILNEWRCDITSDFVVKNIETEIKLVSAPCTVL